MSRNPNDGRGRFGRGRGGRGRGGRGGYFANRNYGAKKAENDVVYTQKFKPHNPDLKILHYVYVCSIRQWHVVQWLDYIMWEYVVQMCEQIQ